MNTIQTPPEYVPVAGRQASGQQNRIHVAPPWIRPMTDGDLSAVAALHQQGLPTRLHGHGGRTLLMLYYGELLRSADTIGLVADQDGDITGFVCGVRSRGVIRRRLLTRHKLRLCLLAIRQLSTSLRTLRDLGRRWLIPAASPTDAATHGDIELRPIVVSDRERGRGIADRLMHAFVQQVEELGRSSVWLRTAARNKPAIRAYEKFGFRRVRSNAATGNAAEVFFHLDVRTIVPGAELTTLGQNTGVFVSSSRSGVPSDTIRPHRRRGGC